MAAGCLSNRPKLFAQCDSTYYSFFFLVCLPLSCLSRFCYGLFIKVVLAFAVNGGIKPKPPLSWWLLGLSWTSFAIVLDRFCILRNLSCRPMLLYLCFWVIPVFRRCLCTYKSTQWELGEEENIAHSGGDVGDADGNEMGSGAIIR